MHDLAKHENIIFLAMNRIQHFKMRIRIRILRCEIQNIRPGSQCYLLTQILQ